MNDAYGYTDDQVEKIYQQIKIIVTSGRYTVNNPVAFLLGGQPGAGKTTLHEIIGSLEKNIVIINGDDFRKFHPKYKLICEQEEDFVPFTQEFSSSITERLIFDLSTEKYNLLIEGTLRTTTVPIKTCETLKSEGYSYVGLYIMAVSREVSWASTVDRYNEMCRLGMCPRATTKFSHDSVVNVIADNLTFIKSRGCFDEIRIYNRAKNCLYSNLDSESIDPGDLLYKIINSGQIKIRNKKTM